MSKLNYFKNLVMRTRVIHLNSSVSELLFLSDKKTTAKGKHDSQRETYSI